MHHALHVLDTSACIYIELFCDLMLYATEKLLKDDTQCLPVQMHIGTWE